MSANYLDLGRWNVLVALANVGELPHPAVPAENVVVLSCSRVEQEEILTPTRELWKTTEFVVLPDGVAQPPLPNWSAVEWAERLNRHFGRQRMFANGQDDFLAEIGVKHDGCAYSCVW